MGINNFFKLSHDGKSITSIAREIELSELSGHRIAVDASYIIYNSILAFNVASQLSDSQGNLTGHIVRSMNLIQMFKRNNIDNVWIFDSPKPSAMKKIELEKRRDRKKAATNEKYKYTLSENHINDIKSLLTYSGISYIDAPDEIEAEHYAAYLCKGKNSYCSFVFSGDSDVLAFGGNLLRNIKGNKNKKTKYELYILDDLLREYDISYDQLLEIAVAMGTDFQKEKIKNIGPKTAIKKIKNGIDIPDELQKVMQFFKSSIKVSTSDLKKSKFDSEKIKEFLLSREFGEKKIMDYLKYF